MPDPVTLAEMELAAVPLAAWPFYSPEMRLSPGMRLRRGALVGLQGVFVGLLGAVATLLGAYLGFWAAILAARGLDGGNALIYVAWLVVFVPFGVLIGAGLAFWAFVYFANEIYKKRSARRP